MSAVVSYCCVTYLFMAAWFESHGRQRDKQIFDENYYLQEFKNCPCQHLESKLAVKEGGACRQLAC